MNNSYIWDNISNDYSLNINYLEKDLANEIIKILTRKIAPHFPTHPHTLAISGISPKVAIAMKICMQVPEYP